VKKAFSEGYSGGSGAVGLDVASAPKAAVLNAPTDDGPITCRSVIEPSLCTLNVTTTWPCDVIAAYGINQFRFTCATKRRIHGPNSTPLVSNWIAGPNAPPPCEFSNWSRWTYRCRFRSASPSEPPLSDRVLAPNCGAGFAGGS